MPKDSAPETSLPASLSYAEFAGLGQEAITAAMNSNAAFSAGLEKISQEVALYARDSFTAAGETARGMLGARTLEDVVRLQTDFAKHSFDELMERTAKLSELGCALLGAGFSAWAGRAKILAP